MQKKEVERQLSIASTAQVQDQEDDEYAPAPTPCTCIPYLGRSSRKIAAGNAR
jgi:hypothetical protein